MDDKTKDTKQSKRGARLHKGGAYVGSSQLQADIRFGRALMAAAKKAMKAAKKKGCK